MTIKQQVMKNPLVLFSISVYLICSVCVVLCVFKRICGQEENNGKMSFLCFCGEVGFCFVCVFFFLFVSSLLD